MSSSTFRKVAALVVSIGFACLAILSPDGWYQPASLNSELPAPRFDGAILLRACFILDAALVMAAAYWPRGIVSARQQKTQMAALSEIPGDVSDRVATRVLIAVCVLAVALRIIGLDSGLWLDEISPVVDYGQLSAMKVIATYLGSANHLFNTLLVNESIALFGRHEWAIRLPAALFGMLTIPAIYFVTRIALSRRASLAAAILLTTSYHHVFFSQNARGYTAYLLFSLLSCGLLAGALQRNQRRDWLAYVLISVLNVASLLNSVFVIAAHGIIALARSFEVWRNSRSTELLKSTLVSFFLTGFFAVHIYALVIPQILNVMNTTYKMKSAGFSSPLSKEFIYDLLSGLSPAIAAGAAGIGLLAAVVGMIGLLKLFRSNRVLTAALVLPNILLFIFVIVEQVSVTPRLFLFTLIVAVICAASGIDWTINKVFSRTKPIARNVLLVTAISGTAVLSSLSLIAYYSIPKQDYAIAIKYLQSQRHPTDVVIVAYLAKYGFTYYSRELSVDLDSNTFFIRDEQKFSEIVRRSAGRRVWVVNTFERALRLDLPAMDQALQKDWVVAYRARGTIADGNILIYRSKEPNLRKALGRRRLSAKSQPH